MSKPNPLAWLGAVGVAALASAGCSSTEPIANGAAAPKFSLAASDGKTHTLESLTSGGTVFFYGIKNGCPVNAKAEDFYDQLARAYAGKATFVGVSNLTADTFPKWDEKFDPSYTVIFDPKKELISGLGMERSPWLVQVGRSGKVVKSWPGYSGLDLEDMSEAMAASAGIQPAALDFDAAPAATSYG